MSENLNITGNIIEFINDIGQHWTRRRGLVLTLIVEFICLLFFWEKFFFVFDIVFVFYIVNDSSVGDFDNT